MNDGKVDVIKDGKLDVTSDGCCCLMMNFVGVEDMIFGGFVLVFVSLGNWEEI